MNEIGETKTPNAGEWWLQNYDGTIVYICGADPDGDPVYVDDDERFYISTLRFFNQKFNHEPRCTGFDWLPVADIPLNPVPGKVVATGTVTLNPVESPDDWVEFDSAHITCPRVGIDWLTLRLGERLWMPAMLAWSNVTWAAQREIWKIRCRRCDLPVQPDNMVAIIAEHTTQVRELTQRIGDLVQQVNQRDAVIEGIRTALHVNFV